MGMREEWIFDDLKNGNISEWDAKQQLERLNGSCGCMDRPTESLIRDVQDGYRDPWEASREYDREKASCDYNDMLAREEREAMEREQRNGW